MPSVDVLIPHYNDSVGLARSLESVKAQNWEGRFRIVLADDGSTRDELHAVHRLLDTLEFDHIVTVNTENRGRPYTRNVLLDHMDADFVAWLDAGDEWYPDKTRLQIETATKTTGTRSPDHYWITCAYAWIQEGVPLRHHAQKTAGDMIAELLRGTDLRGYLWTILAPPAAMAAVGRFDERLPRLQDLDFFIRFALKGGTIVSPDTTEPLCAYYKQHQGRAAAQIIASQQHIRAKYSYLYSRYGKKFELLCDHLALKSAARFARANGDIGLAKKLKRQARVLKWWMILRP